MLDEKSQLDLSQKIKVALSDCDTLISKEGFLNDFYDFYAFFHQLSESQQLIVLNILKTDIQHIVTGNYEITFFLQNLSECVKNTFLKNSIELLAKGPENLVQLIELFNHLNSFESVKIVIDALGNDIYKIIPDAYSINFFVASFAAEKRTCITDFLMNGASFFLKTEVDHFVLSQSLTLKQWGAALKNSSLKINMTGVCSVLNGLHPDFARVFLNTHYDYLKKLIIRPNDINFLHKNLNEANFKLVFNNLNEKFPLLVKQWRVEHNKCVAMKKSLVNAQLPQVTPKTIDKELMLVEILVGIAEKSSGKRRKIIIEKIKERCPSAIKNKEEKELSDSLFGCAFSLSVEYSAIAIGLIVAAIAISLLLTCGLAVVPCALSSASIGFLSGFVFFANNQNNDNDLPVLKTADDLNNDMICAL